MSTFTEHFEEAKKLHPKDQVGYISAKFAEALAGGGSLSLWRPGDPTPRMGARALIGVAPYSGPDAKLLDALVEALVKHAKSNERIDVFNVLACTSMGDFECYIPGIGSVYQTPVIGIWEDAVLSRKASGAAARNLIIDRYALNFK